MQSTDSEKLEHFNSYLKVEDPFFIDVLTGGNTFCQGVADFYGMSEIDKYGPFQFPGRIFEVTKMTPEERAERYPKISPEDLQRLGDNNIISF